MVSSPGPHAGHLHPPSRAAGCCTIRDITWTPKHWVALSGGVIYGTSFFASLHKGKWSLWINIIGPCIGLTSIIGGWLLGFDIHPDTFQIMGGIPQVCALLTSVQLLRSPRIRYMD